MFGKKCCDTCRTSRVRNHQTMNTVKFIVGFTEQKINSYSVPSHYIQSLITYLKQRHDKTYISFWLATFLIFNFGDRTHSFQISLRLIRRPKECCSPSWFLNISSLIFEILGMEKKLFFQNEMMQFRGIERTGEAVQEISCFSYNLKVKKVKRA